MDGKRQCKYEKKYHMNDLTLIVQWKIVKCITVFLFGICTFSNALESSKSEMAQLSSVIDSLKSYRGTNM